MPVCFKCDKHLPTVNALSVHLHIIHKIFKSDTHRCSEFGCSGIFSNWERYRKHLNSFHLYPTKLKTECALISSNINSQCGETQNEMNKNSFHNVTEQLNSNNECTKEQKDITRTLKEPVLAYIAKLYANHQLPRNHIQNILDDSRDLMQQMILAIEPIMKDILINNGVNQNTIVSIKSCFEQLLEPFSELSSECRRFKAFSETGCFINSVDHTVGQRTDEKLHNGNIVKEIVPVFAKFIPMRVVLQKIFNLPHVFSSVNSYVNTLLQENNIIENFVQGDLWRNKIKFHFQNKIVFPLFIYYDDFEVNNALGTHTGIQKLGAVYYSIACFPPEVNSLLENIFLAMLFHSSDRIEFNNHSIFNILIDELNYLQTEGIEIEPNKGEKIRIYFALGLLLGDNLGLNGILGFVESFNAHYSCRLCKTSKHQWQTEFFEKRMREHTYESDVLLKNTAESGIKEKSIWDQVFYFKTSQNFTADWLHDGPEGWFKFVIQCILHHYIMKKPCIVPLNILNDRLKTFDYYHNNISNKPPLISYDEIKSKKLSMSGSESSNFIFMFAMLVGDLIPENDKVWPLYLKMREIMDLILAPKLQKETCNLFRVLVSEFHMMFAELFPSERFTPKSHNFAHYGTIFQFSGPIRNLSTIRFEAKHKNKKKEANATTSRRNITHTLCIKEQL
ncbi:PREDICTED: uncharacterized protein LOC105456901, partial [Wasmannia auropunctata]|uniref:uncharacterized protein LOC105456901 n=1 Tax=Wasmannia auropunctata TaxID=64793 RepID=UPI0005EF9143